jgi:aldehyde dehydrogenase (NAD+)
MCYEFADRIAGQGVRLALTDSMDTGQTIALSKFSGMLACGTVRNLGYYAATKFPWEEEVPFSGNIFAPAREYIRREPIGVCVGIIPWNSPILMASWKIAHAIVMGNTIVLKPASSTQLTALIMAEAAQAAGIPPGVINVVTGSGAELGNTLCTHPDVDKIAFTGSTAVGAQIMRMASDTAKKVTLELGGKSANIILDDADTDLAVEGAIFGTFFHQGQVCESGTRVLVAGKIYDQFVERLRKRAEELQVGYQLLPSSHLGPLISANQLATVEGYVKAAASLGRRSKWRPGTPPLDTRHRAGRGSYRRRQQEGGGQTMDRREGNMDSPLPEYTAELLRHFADLRDGTHGGASSRRDK